MNDDEVSSTPNGLLQCLRMLAEEASILHLDRTYAALIDALDTCRIEVTGSNGDGLLGSVPRGMAIH